MTHPTPHPCCLVARRRAPIALAVVAAMALPVIAADKPDEDTPSDSKTLRTPGSGLRWGADSLRVEGIRLPDHPTARSTVTGRGHWFATMKATSAIEWRVGLRTDVDMQRNVGADRRVGEVSWGDTWLRWRGDDARITAGLQTVLWGRVDAISLLDRVSRVDLRRFALDELKERRLPQPILRWEHGWGDLKSDLVLMPAHLDAQLPHRDSIWHPVNRTSAHIIGTPAAPALAGFYAAAPLRNQAHRQGGAALRLTHSGDGLDLGVTAGRVRQPLPFFSIDLAGNTLRASHPLNSFVAADFELATDAITWRAELAHTRGLPMTSLANGALSQASSTEFAGGAELFPGGKDTRLNLQLLLRSVRTGVPTVELQRYASLSGEIETSLATGKVKAAVRFASALNLHDVYVSPRVAYLGWEPHEVYAAAHLFKGQQRGFGGFFANTNALAVGFKTRF